jgi:ankyrin repeat protein
MPDSFHSLISAILADDRAKVKALLKSAPGLVARGTGAKSEFAAGVMHWIYAGDTALHVAAGGYRVVCARLLLAAGADADAAKSRRRSQPLHYASDGHGGSPAWNPGRQVETIRLLLEAGARIDAQDQNGATPLHRAVRTRSASAVKWLLGAGADPTIRNKPGSTPFHLAVQNTGRGGTGAAETKAAQREIIEAFVEHGVSPDLMDAKGKSVLEWARSEWIHDLLMRKTP